MRPLYLARQYSCLSNRSNARTLGTLAAATLRQTREREADKRDKRRRAVLSVTYMGALNGRFYVCVMHAFPRFCVPGERTDDLGL